MRIVGFLLAISSFAFPSNLQAAEYPISGVWASSNGPSSNDITASCASYLKNPKAPVGNLIVFKGSKKTEFNGGYIEVETVDNLSVKKVGENEFQVIDRYYDDGEDAGRPGFKRRSYKLRLINPDKIEIKEGSYPSSQYVQCSSQSSFPPSLPLQNRVKDTSKPSLAVNKVQIRQNTDGMPIALSGLTDVEACHPNKIDGQIVSRSFANDALTLNGIIIEEKSGQRVYINVDKPADVSQVEKNLIYQGLQTLARVGRTATLDVMACGAAGRTFFLNGIK